MNIEIKAGSTKYLDDCEKILRDSELGVQYFEKEGSAKKAIMEGLNSGNLYVALSNSLCVGFMYYLPEGAFHSYPYLHLIAVRDEHRRRGVGKVLISFFEEIVFKVKNKAFLVVAEFNPGGKLFYEKLGYTQVGVIPSLYREGINEYLLMKKRKQGSKNYKNK